MKYIKDLLEGDLATQEILTANNYNYFGTFLGDPIYDNGNNQIVVRDDVVERIYDFNAWDSDQRL